MKSRYSARCLGGLILLAAYFTTFGLAAKPIRLRNGTITPLTPGQSLAGGAAGAVALVEPPATGLFLVQFAAPPTLEQRDQLRAAGVELLQYVPEDSFIARFTTASPAAVRLLSFVTWLGPYRPEYKIHRALLRSTGSDTNRPVAVLLAPGASSRRAPGLRRRNTRRASWSRVRTSRSTCTWSMQPSEIDVSFGQRVVCS